MGEGLSKCCEVVIHCKCNWNTTRSQRKKGQRGWWCSNTRHKGIAPGRLLKAPPISSTLSFSNTPFSSERLVYKAATALWSRKWFLPLPWLASISMNECTMKWFSHRWHEIPEFQYHIIIFKTISVITALV